MANWHFVVVAEHVRFHLYSSIFHLNSCLNRNAWYWSKFFTFRYRVHISTIETYARAIDHVRSVRFCTRVLQGQGIDETISLLFLHILASRIIDSVERCLREEYNAGVTAQCSKSLKENTLQTLSLKKNEKSTISTQIQCSFSPLNWDPKDSVGQRI